VSPQLAVDAAAAGASSGQKDVPAALKAGSSFNLISLPSTTFTEKPPKRVSATPHDRPPE
jgi:hypothetical protein